MTDQAERPNPREPLIYEGAKLWSMGTFPTGHKAWTYGDGRQELLPGPVEGRAGGVPVTAKEPVVRNERVRLGKASDGTWEARRWKDDGA